MGSSSWTSMDWKDFSTKKIENRNVSEIYSQRKGLDDFNPCNFNIRESCDSEEHPNSNAIIVALDVSGSMTPVLKSVVSEGLPILCKEIYERKPITDPQVMFMGIGDVESDSYPIQATQFESDIRIAEQLTKIYLEQNGGSNSYETYIGAWYMGAFRTKIDCFKNRNKRGYLFTIGDERPTPKISKENIKKFFGDDVQSDMTNEDLYNAVSEYYNVFHLILKQGNYCNERRHPGNFEKVCNEWKTIIGQNAIVVDDYTKIAQIIVSTIQIVEGENISKVIDSWDGSTSITVKNAVNGIQAIKKDSVVVL